MEGAPVFDTPATLFSARIDPGGVLDVLRAQGATVKVDVEGHNWRRGTATWNGGLFRAKRVMGLGHEPQYYADENFEPQLSGMTRSALRFGASLPFLEAIRSFRFAIAVRPGTYNRRDPRWAAVLATTAHLDGVIVTLDGILDARGRKLAWPEGPPDPAAVAPAFADPNPILTPRGSLYRRDAVTEGQLPPHRARSVEILAAAGFATPWGLPGRKAALRPPQDIARRLLALNGLYSWATGSKANAVQALANLDHDGLRSELTESEAALLSGPRSPGVEQIRWKLENMWPLAWALGHGATPRIDFGMINNTRIDTTMRGFLKGSLADLLARATPRPLTELAAIGDLFYCAHHAVKAAQRARATVPRGFHPADDGRVIYERRHAITWMVSPGNGWDDIDLSD